MKQSKTWPQLVATILINEIIPRAKKHNNVYPPIDICWILCHIEFNKQYDRKTTRRLLDQWYEQQTS